MRYPFRATDSMHSHVLELMKRLQGREIEGAKREWPIREFIDAIYLFPVETPVYHGGERLIGREC